MSQRGVLTLNRKTLTLTKRQWSPFRRTATTEGVLVLYWTHARYLTILVAEFAKCLVFTATGTVAELLGLEGFAVAAAEPTGLLAATGLLATAEPTGLLATAIAATEPTGLLATAEPTGLLATAEPTGLLATAIAATEPTGLLATAESTGLLATAEPTGLLATAAEPTGLLAAAIAA
ncbi:DUF1118 domain-containing protein [Paeniglutamicibacter sulfureus]|uniref:Uncharacterized protein n=1 Tax=Paeniglutamicibacter sulfureus TaxID=43666 RepID=A0ABU2BFZ1_9MICC|nr:DUF1118 domain-containing protein [Paeniglutamicibacter sulfureus]MDR7356314.1 hypothetical protein [Paeniglutamicibacter sulfureus]